MPRGEQKRVFSENIRRVSHRNRFLSCALSAAKHRTRAQKRNSDREFVGGLELIAQEAVPTGICHRLCSRHRFPSSSASSRSSVFASAYSDPCIVRARSRYKEQHTRFTQPDSPISPNKLRQRTQVEVPLTTSLRNIRVAFRPHTEASIPSPLAHPLRTRHAFRSQQKPIRFHSQRTVFPA
ncbi:inositol oxygenase [Pseudozyma hubeiensis SY62]|uniref:Inositol oxygenase n=1 Tax=Pseudozyma hubeiensis (strain SY62) TaxID=1305764 RepID=R9NYP2_PSEHS|nr:inositol oxygenase [Pseudozyma hubeiensis SY62]GAC93806.1 inositol oxygenase [Pseudozyma hubeiensis SY62]